MPVGLLYGLFVFGASFVVDDLFNVQADGPLRAVAPLAFVYPFVHLAIQLAQGVGRLHVYSVASAVGHLCFLGLLVALLVVDAEITSTRGLVLRAAAFLVRLGAPRRVAAAGLPRGERASSDDRRAGADLGISRLHRARPGVGTYSTDVLMLGALRDAREVGLYSLAVALATPLSLPGTGIAGALFPRMVQRQRVERRWLILTCALGLIGVVALTLVAGPLVDALFSSRYAPAVAFVFPLALASAVRGVTALYNSVLSAAARGRDLQRAALVLTASNVALNLLLIPPYGPEGAAWASLGALAANLGAHVFYYRRTLR